MPKIDAPTVAEHHQRRRAALLAAATDLLAEQGVDGLSLGAVGAAAGLARSSVYQYFESTAALLAAVVEDVMAQTRTRLTAAMEAAETAPERLDAFVRTTLATATEPAPRSLHALDGATLPPECLARVAELHQQLHAPLLEALVELGVPAPELSMQLLVAVVVEGARAIVDGSSPDLVLTRTLDLLHHGIGSGAAR